MAMLLANRVAGAARFVGAPAPRHSLRTQNGSVTCMAASRPMWLPGRPHLCPTPSALPCQRRPITVWLFAFGIDQPMGLAAVAPSPPFAPVTMSRSSHSIMPHGLIAGRLKYGKAQGLLRSRRL